MTTAAQKALAVPELLEAVLVELPPYDLLMSQKVNKDFKATVERSSKIQQKLFLKSKHCDSMMSGEINPFLGRALNYFGFHRRAQISGKAIGMVDALYPYLDAPKSNRSRFCGGNRRLYFRVDPGEREGIASMPLSGSFGNMLIGDPPRLHLGIILKGESWEIKTLGQLINELLHEYSYWVMKNGRWKFDNGEDSDGRESGDWYHRASLVRRLLRLTDHVIAFDVVSTLE